ncbi:ABC transporter permease [Bradyrhizobium sp. BRP20]|uniref:ABC transporter permease n=1 Tax=unclassified Bradyrhizobium TaxID=2631580 RepID=UPI001CD6EFCB|nr:MULTISPECIES: ABC transporter permease [unclassified Bradyrhizobium]MCA1436821.1 ABC transporter permease [Bradyrhizobium sp. BRP20]MCA1470735.1 ABC transporter permease [Bradyrhizobium sp. IC3195]MCA1552485.1 ABC transporter permease [Bradyrhizobium sp. BRP19]
MSFATSSAGHAKAFITARVLTGARRFPVRVYVAAFFMAFFLIAAIEPKLLQTHDPLVLSLTSPLKAPSLTHWLGTDQSGRDLYSRIVAGTRQSLSIGLGATALSLALALALGVTAGLSGGWIDNVLSRLFDALFALPTLFLALLFVSLLGTSVPTLVIAVGLGTSPGYARMVRVQVLSVKATGYVEAAKALGHSPRRILFKHILPNAISPLATMFTLGVGQAIIWASGLSFLGLGVAPPSSEWGALLNAGRNYVIYAWWLEVMPGIAIAAFALSVTVVGQYVQQRLEGRIELL